MDPSGLGNLNLAQLIEVSAAAQNAANQNANYGLLQNVNRHIVYQEQARTQNQQPIFANQAASSNLQLAAAAASATAHQNLLYNKPIIPTKIFTNILTMFVKF